MAHAERRLAGEESSKQSKPSRVMTTDKPGHATPLSRLLYTLKHHSVSYIKLNLTTTTTLAHRRTYLGRRVDRGGHHANAFPAGAHEAGRALACLCGVKGREIQCECLRRGGWPCLRVAWAGECVKGLTKIVC